MDAGAGQAAPGALAHGNFEYGLSAVSGRQSGSTSIAAVERYVVNSAPGPPSLSAIAARSGGPAAFAWASPSRSVTGIFMCSAIVKLSRMIVTMAVITVPTTKVAAPTRTMPATLAAVFVISAAVWAAS